VVELNLVGQGFPPEGARLPRAGTASGSILAYFVAV